MKRYVVISDTQYPYQDQRKVNAVIRFIGETQPDEVIHIGDLMDYPTPSRWTKGTAEEFSQRLYPDSVACQEKFLRPLREVYDGPIGIHEGNHDERPRVYLYKYAPALAGSDAFNFETLLNFDEFGINVLPQFYKIAPGALTTHGHVGKISLARDSGGTALRAANKFNASVTMGHTHRGGLKYETRGYNYTVTSKVFGLEVGHLMDMKKAKYLKGGTGNWQAGFGILDVEGRHVQPQFIEVTNRFVVDGRVWEV